jgi:hypothetical protein
MKNPLQVKLLQERQRESIRCAATAIAQAKGVVPKERHQDFRKKQAMRQGWRRKLPFDILRVGRFCDHAVRVFFGRLHIRACRGSACERVGQTAAGPGTRIS